MKSQVLLSKKIKIQVKLLVHTIVMNSNDFEIEISKKLKTN